MLKIILCDDDRFILRLGADRINEMIEENGFDAKVVSTVSDSSELFSYIRNNPAQYLIFMDLDFGSGKLNGIDAASILRQMESDCKVVFTTNHHEKAMDVLKSGVEPFGFLEKSSDISKLVDGYRKYIVMLLNKTKSETSDNAGIILLNPCMDESVSVLIDDIVFIETEKTVSHGITYHTVNGSVLTIIGTLDTELERLGENFIKVHRSYIVNKKHILKMKDGFLKLSNQQEVPCSFRMRNEVKIRRKVKCKYS